MTVTHRKLTRDSVIYQIYPRSFGDSNGDGIGDLDGVVGHLDHIASLGVDGIWLSPFFASPQFDMGYDVSDYCAVAPEYGDIDAAQRLIDEAHARGLAVLFDIVPCHTSIEHPWFREHPDWYIIVDTPERPNNWASVFGGSAWDRYPHGPGWYCHTFYPEQPNLNWRNPELVAAMHDCMRFWIDRGVDGFRVDAIFCLFVDDKLRDNPPNPNPRMINHPDWEALHARYNTHLPEIFDALAEIRKAFPEAYFVAEVGGTPEQLRRYTEHFDTTFCFELKDADFDIPHAVEIIEGGLSVPGIAWVLACHDSPRLPSRWGRELARALAVLQMTLPGSAYIYQGDEIGMDDGPGHNPPYDRAGRDPYRHPMQWTRDGGFTTGTPWLPMVNPAECNVADQDSDRDSMLSFYRRLLALRPHIGGPVRDLREENGVIAFSRESHRVAINLSGATVPWGLGEVLLTTHDLGEKSELPPHTAVVSRA